MRKAKTAPRRRPNGTPKRHELSWAEREAKAIQKQKRQQMRVRLLSRQLQTALRRADEELHTLFLSLAARFVDDALHAPRGNGAEQPAATQ